MRIECIYRMIVKAANQNAELEVARLVAELLPDSQWIKGTAIVCLLKNSGDDHAIATAVASSW